MAYQGSKCKPLPGELFVAKMASMAFEAPKISMKLLTPDLLVDWNSNPFSLDEWTHPFMLVSNSELPAEFPTSFANLKAKEIFAAKAETNRMPGKRKADYSFSLLGFCVLPH
jgi:hypothetical protein